VGQVVAVACSSFHYVVVVASCWDSSDKLMAVEVIHKVMAVCNDQEGAGSYALASIVRSLVASDEGGSSLRLVASTAAASAAVMAEADSVFYVFAVVLLVEQISVDGEVIETPIRCLVTLSSHGKRPGLSSILS